MATKEVDLINRDPNSMNHFIQVDFEDVLAEPTGARSADCVWRNAFKCFDCGKNCCYKLLSFFTGICIALGWGCAFGILAFEVIWVCVPGLRYLNISLHPIKKYFSIILSACAAPYYETLGLMFSRIHVTQSQGPPPRPLNMLDGDENQGKVKNFK